MHIGLAVHRNAKRDPEAIAVFGEKSQSYGELEDRSNQIANFLKSYDWGKGERVAVLLPNRPEILELITAIAKASLVYVGLNFRLGQSEMKQIFENCEDAIEESSKHTHLGSFFLDCLTTFFFTFLYALFCFIF